MTIEFRIGDVFDRLAEIPDGSIDLVVTSPPFLALRSYLPADHPDKHREIGSEATPADFLDTLLALTAEWGRVLAPHGSICVELGDTYSGKSGADDGTVSHRGAWKDRTPDPVAALQRRDDRSGYGPAAGKPDVMWRGGSGWPLGKSLTGIPTLYAWSLAYGRNLLTGQPSPAGQWRIRNVIVWARPNPPVGALGDKFRPATSYITVACKSAKRYFDLDAVRTPTDIDHPGGLRKGALGGTDERRLEMGDTRNMTPAHPAGAPPLDWHTDNHPEDGDWLWKLPTQPYKGSHYAVYPEALPKRLIEAMCPQKVCTVCGQPSERIVGEAEYVDRAGASPGSQWASSVGGVSSSRKPVDNGGMARLSPTLGWTDCGHDSYRSGVVLDPFAGSGTTLAVALGVGRHAIGIDLDARNADLARDRVGMFLDVDHGTEAGAA